MVEIMLLCQHDTISCRRSPDNKCGLLSVWYQVLDLVGCIKISKRAIINKCGQFFSASQRITGVSASICFAASFVDFSVASSVTFSITFSPAKVSSVKLWKIQQSCRKYIPQWFAHTGRLWHLYICKVPP